ncbi:Fic family protein [Roseomonas sp. OT10]|uniref:Fic family protein n=1 Tax=Roseomonas cutis TaxID=2897332 RepID=UPI001E322F22|nr:Fic family protein [Roseomonas sp. OT10]UFN49608.1 Fic family protein [Roseomonas sp. OT10]
MLQFNSSPYSLSVESTHQVVARLRAIEERVALLRQQGTLTKQTLLDYYGLKRFEQIAESNAIEGSTLSVGETEAAVLKGITITGHDPGYVRDAIALDKALTRVVDIAKNRTTPTDIDQLKEIHNLLLGDRPGAGAFRSERVIISGSNHTPPKTWHEIILHMEHWQKWSLENKDAPAPFRSALLHAWLTHIHPFIDGNGRVSRAIGNLELIRAGYPPIIFKKSERDRYIECLSEADDAGDIRSFMDLVFDRTEGALTGLELSARKQQGYSPAIERLRNQQKQQLTIWSTGVKLLASVIEHQLTRALEATGGRVITKIFDGLIDLEDYTDICAGRAISGGWAFILNIQVPGMPKLEKLVFMQPRSQSMYHRLGQESGPSLYWSRVNPAGYPKWMRDGNHSPYAIEVTSRSGSGDNWVALLADGKFVELTTTDLASKFSDALLHQVGH